MKPEHRDDISLQRQVEEFAKEQGVPKEQITTIVCGRRSPRRCQNCRIMLYAGGVLCDAEVASGRTCDRFECRKCSERVAPDRDHCSRHKEKV